mgnify:FL=1
MNWVRLKKLWNIQSNSRIIFKYMLFYLRSNKKINEGEKYEISSKKSKKEF